MSGLVKWAAKNPLIILLVALAIMIGGGWAFSQMPIDAVPDVTNIQVQVVTRVPALSAGMVAVHVRRGPWGRLHDAPTAAISVRSLEELPDALARV